MIHETHDHLQANVNFGKCQLDLYHTPYSTYMQFVIQQILRIKSLATCILFKKIIRLALLPPGAFYDQLDSNPDSDSKQLDPDSDSDSRK